MKIDEARHGIWSVKRDTDQRRTHGRRSQRLSMPSGSWRSITSACGAGRSSWERRAASAPDHESRKNVPSGGGKATEMFCAQIAYNYFQASWLLLRVATSFFPGAFVVGIRGCMWFVCAPSNNCTISPIDKWISRRGARTVGACTEGAGAAARATARAPAPPASPNPWRPAASQINPLSFHKTIQTPRCPQQQPRH